MRKQSSFAWWVIFASVAGAASVCRPYRTSAFTTALTRSLSSRVL